MAANQRKLRLINFRAKSLSELLRDKSLNNYNLHRIAISNLQSAERQIERWWCKKYKRPLKEYDEHTIEELMIEMLEDYYDKNPQEAKKFLNVAIQEDDWDGSTSPEYEAEIQARLRKINKRNRVDISKYQTPNENVSDEQFEEILRNVGRNLPKSKVSEKKEDGSLIIESDEFDDAF